jgi:hypothetical protein
VQKAIDTKNKIPVITENKPVVDNSSVVLPAPETTTNAMTNLNKKSNNRIDYASTLEEAYDNLDKILGSDGIKNLTTDTHKLMSKQQELFQSMQTISPLLSQAKELLGGFDMKNLEGLASFAGSLGKST